MIKAFQNRKCTKLHWAILFSLLSFLVIMYLEMGLLVNHPWSGLELKTSKTSNGLEVKAINHPELRGHLYRGDKIVAIKSDKMPYISLGSYSLVDEPDNFPTLGQYNASFHHNAALYERLSSSRVTIKTKTGKEISFTPIQQRPTASFPLNFWITNFTALFGLLFAAGIWTYKKKDITTRLLISTGLFFFIASTASAIYASRSLALLPSWYSFLTAINHLAMPIVAYSLLALLLVYPYRLVSSNFILVLFLIPIILWLNTLLQWTDLPFHTFYLGMILAFCAGIPPAIKQWQLSKNKPLERAALQWMLLSIFFAAGSEVFLYFLPTILGKTPYLPFWAAQLVFLPLYVGFVLGVFKYRLFDVERWWLISWHWVIGGLLIVFIDLLLIWLLHLHPLGALSVAIILVAWVYFPLRQWLWRHIAQMPATHLENHIHDLIQIFIGGNPNHDFKQRWQKLLNNIFCSSSTEIAGGQIDSPIIIQQGMNMLVPGITGNYHIDLYGRNQSTRLFNKRDIVLVGTLTELAIQTKTLREAQEKGIQLERDRIMRDLHDDVGANLLSMIYRAKDEDDADLARDTLKLLRETIYTLDDRVSMNLPLAIAKWRQEIWQRCQNNHVELLWKINEKLPALDLNPRQHVNLGRVMREILTNALKHARPSYFSANFDVDENELHILIRHDGTISPIETWHDGKGMPGIKSRISELQGKIDWRLADELQTTLSIPLSIALQNITN